MSLLRQSCFPTLVLAIVLHPETCLSSPPPGEAATPAPITTPPSAQELYVTAQAQYSTGDLVGALTTMQRCYEAKPSANIIFNLAQLHRELSHCSEALDHYQRYLDAAPDGERAVDARRFVDVLLQQCPPAKKEPNNQDEVADLHASQVQPEPTPVPPSANSTVLQPQPPPRSYSPWNNVGWIALGTGIVTGATSIYFAVAAKRAQSDVEGLVTAAESTPHPDTNAIYARNGDFQRYRTLGWVFGGVAVASIATCGYAWLVGGRGESTPATAWALTLSPKALVAGYSTDF